MKSFCICLLLILEVFTCQLSLSEPIVHKIAEGKWVQPVEIKVPIHIPTDNIQDGQYYLVADRQVFVKDNHPTQYYRHYAIKIVNTLGLEATSQISFTFDPTYQQASLNTLAIIRQDERIDMLHDAEIQLLRREKEMDALVYDGRYTANIIMRDVRIDDIIEYSYTITGDNPIYSNLFFYNISTSWSIPVQKNNFQLIWPKSRRLFQKSHNTELFLTKYDRGDHTVFSLTHGPVDSTRRNTQTPGWFQRYGYIQLSETKDWQSVVDWALPLYSEAYNKPDAIILKTVDQIYKDNSSDMVKAIKALNYVQNDIRYLGIEFGVNSHKPSLPQDTLKRRYGDCKDKAVAYISLLNRMGIEAYPVLVNTKLKQKIASLHPTIDAFDHVITRVTVYGKQYWLDPTMKYQGQNIETIFQPDYGMALVISPDETQLSQMPENDHLYGIHFEETFDLRAGFTKPATYQVFTNYKGFDAEDNRYEIAEDGRKEIQERYLNYYSNYYDHIEMIKPLRVDDNPVKNKLRVQESYQINRFWEKNTEKNRWQAKFYTNALYEYLKYPKQRKRHEPFRLSHPVNVRQTIRVRLPAQWNHQHTTFSEQNPHFKFNSIASYDSDSRTLELDYHYISLRDAVNTDELDDYLIALADVKDELDYLISKPLNLNNIKTTKSKKIGLQEAFIFLSFVGIFVLFIYCIAEWWKDTHEPGPAAQSNYLPVSIKKLFILNFTTLGIYQLFWFYKNWKYVKTRDDNHLMPFWRALFAIVWYYPFYLELRRDSQKRFGKSILPKPPLIIFLLILYIVLNLFNPFDDIFTFLNLLSVLCLLPFVRYINHINQRKFDHAPPYFYLRPRHYIFNALIIVPLIVFGFGIHLNWFPNGEVIQGHQLPSWDVKFMQRKGLLNGNEKLLYFYSDASFFTRNEGNGVTNSKVFTYWHDKEHGTLHTKTIAFENIEDIHVQYSEASNKNTIITIQPKRGPSFTLYVSSENGKDKVFVKAIQDKIET